MIKRRIKLNKPLKPDWKSSPVPMRNAKATTTFVSTSPPNQKPNQVLEMVTLEVTEGPTGGQQEVKDRGVGLG